MKTLSIRQPWAWLIANGYKDIENRTWKTKFRGRVLIHAGKRDIDEEWYAAQPIMEELGLDGQMPNEFHFGGVVGVVDIVDCVDTHYSHWFTGPYGFVLANAKPLPFLPAKGRLGFFDVEYPDQATMQFEYDDNFLAKNLTLRGNEPGVAEAIKAAWEKSTTENC